MRDGRDWGVAQKSGYPADVGKIRRIVLALADMTLVEPKTREPEPLSAPRGRGSRAKANRPWSRSRTSRAPTSRALIVGKRAYDRLGEGNDGVYVRKPGDPQSWLARGSLDFSDDMPNWLDRRIVDIPDNRIAKVGLTQPDGIDPDARAAAKPDAKFALDNPPKDDKYKSDTVLSEPAMALETLDLDDVRPAAKLAVPDKGVTTASYTTFDGLTVAVKLFPHDNKNWIAFAAPGSGKSRRRGEKDRRPGRRWVYAIPSYKAKMMQTKLADLLEAPKGS